MLKPSERDELLIRMDERVKALKNGDEGDIPEIKEHLKALNTQVNKNKTKLAIHSTIFKVIGGCAGVSGTAFGVLKWIDVL